MEDIELVDALKNLMDREQELYKRYLLLGDATDDLELKEIFGHHAFEAFTHLNTIMEKYKELVDYLREQGQI